MNEKVIFDGLMRTATVDFPDDVMRGAYTHEHLDKMMALLKGVGVRRVHWLYYGDADPESDYSTNIYDSPWCTYGRETLDAIGEPLSAAVKAARRAGLEIYGVTKPYYDGLSGTWPEGAPEARRVSVPIRKIGGVLQNTSNFLKKHPEFRLKTHSGEGVARPFGVGEGECVRLYSSTDQDPGLEAKHFRIWASPDNYRYRELDLNFQLEKGLLPYPEPLRDYYGNVVIQEGKRVFAYTFRNLKVDHPYVVIECRPPESHKPQFWNSPMGMVRILDTSGNFLNTVVANHGATWINPRDFKNYGLEFDMGLGHFPYILDQPWGGTEPGDAHSLYQGEDFFEDEASVLFGRNRLGGFIGFAVGQNATAASSLCEGYPEVREYWLGMVDRMIAAGVDGVDIRISAHGALADDPEAFGYNEVIQDAVRRKFGQSPEGMQGKIRKVRGDFYDLFLREASGRARRAGIRFQVHLHAEGFREARCPGRAMGFPGLIDFHWEQWIEKGWVDSALLRTSWYEGSEESSKAQGEGTRSLAQLLSEEIAARMLKKCKEHGLPVILNRYIGRARDIHGYLEDLREARQNPSIQGFDFYEFYDLAGLNPAGDLVERADRVQPLRALPAE